MHTIIDQVYKKTSKSCALTLLLLFGAIIAVLIFTSHHSIQHFGAGFLWGNHWDPAAKQFSALSAIYGTVVTSLIAIVIAVPISLCVALYISYMAPRSIRKGLVFGVQMMAGIPSIIYGMWGLFILTPIMSSVIEPFINQTLGQLPLIGSLLSGPPIGIGVLSAGIILAIMIIPLLTSMLHDLLIDVPSTLIESAYAIGATRFEVIKNVKLPFLRRGLLGSVILGLGRALGETMAVTFVIGNAHNISSSLFMPGTTIASTIANEFNEASSDLYASSLMELGLILMIITFITIIIARLLLRGKY